jgi:hypothetical protein
VIIRSEIAAVSVTGTVSITQTGNDQLYTFTSGTGTITF